MNNWNDRSYSTAEVSAAAGLNRMLLDAWLLRKYLPLPPGPGTGRSRRYSRLDAVRIAVVGELVRLGLGISVAAQAAEFIDAATPEEQKLSLDEPGWMFVLVPPATPQDERLWPHPFILTRCETLNDLHDFLQAKVGTLMSFVFLDATRVAQQVTERLNAAV